MDRNLALEIIHVTKAATLVAVRCMAKGEAVTGNCEISAPAFVILDCKWLTRFIEGVRKLKTQIHLVPDIYSVTTHSTVMQTKLKTRRFIMTV